MRSLLAPATMPRRLCRLLLFAVLVAILGTLARPVAGQSPDLGGIRPGPGQGSFATVVIFTAGIDPFQTNPSSCPPVNDSAGCYDAYVRAAYTFSPVLAALACNTTQQTGTPFVSCPGSRVGWIPYSYAGLVSDVPAPYTGAQTGQSLAVSAARMQALFSFVQSRPETINAKVIVVGHSLGGAVATYWGAGQQAVPVLTLDSPVNGIWPLDAATLNVYCNASVGLLTTTQQVACNRINSAPAATSAAVTEVRQASTIARMGQANALNFANTLDAFVPSWFAVNRASKLGASLKTASCYWESDPVFNHFCIMSAAALDIAGYVRLGILPLRSVIRPTITLTISAQTSGGQPLNGTVTARRLGAVVGQTTTSNGSATLAVPWLDVVVEFAYANVVLSLAALPGSMTDLTLNFVPWTTEPTKSCTPTNPATGGQTVCGITLTSGLYARNTIQDVVLSPAGAQIVSCTSGYFASCGQPSGNTVTATCTFGCPSSSGFTVTVSSPIAGALSEAIIFTANTLGTPIQTFIVTPSPAVTFGGVGGPPPTTPPIDIRR